jgi:hypothetical protein
MAAALVYSAVRWSRGGLQVCAANGLGASKFMFKECYRDQENRRELRRRLLLAGLPE